jgi:hypothetical protein
MSSETDDPRERAHIGASPDLNRAVYERFLSSDYPEALRLADVVLQQDPNDALAQAVRTSCLEALASMPPPARTPRMPIAVESEPVHDEDIITAEVELVSLQEDDLQDDDTETDTAPYVGTSVDPTSPTLSLGERNDAAREVYRLFLASEYAPALELADALIAEGNNDAMVVTIARECRAALTTRSSIPQLSAPIDTAPDVDPRAAFVLSRVDGRMTMEQVARATGMQLDDVLLLLERFVAVGVITLRPPPPPR